MNNPHLVNIQAKLTAQRVLDQITPETTRESFKKTKLSGGELFAWFMKLVYLAK